MKKFFYGKTQITDDRERAFDVSYYIVEDSGKDIYGISVEKVWEGSNVIEIEEIQKVSYSLEKMQRIAGMLLKHQVTPVSLIESVDNILGMEEWDDRSKL